MAVNDILVLIPSHSLEDFPTDQGDQQSAGLLNAFAVAWHPKLIAEAAQLPRWHRADDPPQPQPGQIIFIPEVCDGWLPHDWSDRSRAAGATVVTGLVRRDELAAAAVGTPEQLALDADLVADCYALGTTWLLLELLSRQMRNFGNIDELRLQNRAVSAARAIVAGDRETAEAHLRGAFEVLQEARERFYPVDCYLLDLCLVVPDVAASLLPTVLHQPHATNVLIAGNDLQRLAAEHPATVAALRTAAASGQLCVLGGEARERPLPLLPLESVLWGFHRGQAIYQEVLGLSPRVWGRRRFGLSPVLPQILQQHGYVGALHVALDDGIYPDAEHSRLRWQGVDESLLDAFSRIPLAADSAPSYLRFPTRMAESMDNDHVAAVALARWPEVSAPWFDDLRRMQRYAPVLGKWITFEQLFAASGSPGRLCAYQAKEYFTANLLQHVARREPNPISRYADHVLRRRRFDAALWCRSMTALLLGEPLETAETQSLEEALESCGPDQAAEDRTGPVEQQLSAAEQAWPDRLASVLIGSAQESQPGFLAINPLSFARRVTLSLPDLISPPAIEGPIKAVDFHPTDRASRWVTVDLPGCGFVWIPTNQAARDTSSAGAHRPTTDPWIIRNERIELTLNEETGGILQVRHPLRRENRFSQVLSYRFPRERKYVVEVDGEQRTVRSQYAEARCEGQEIHPGHGAIQSAVTWGVISDPTNHELLARFRQTVRIFRLRPVVHIQIELSDLRIAEGDPWNNYFCCRFAWDDSAASITRSHLDGAHAIAGERFESSDFVEIATASERTTIVTHGLPFHRKTGPRMLDTLLVVAGEERRRFEFTVVLDHAYPLEAARDLTGPVYVVPTSAPPRSGRSGWLFHLDARNVQLQRVLNVSDVPAEIDEHPVRGPGFALRLLETEGRGRNVLLRCFRTPIFARKRDLKGATLRELALDGDAVLIEMRAYEIAEVELRFAQ
jgi:alpha-mannosidase